MSEIGEEGGGVGEERREEAGRLEGRRRSKEKEVKEWSKVGHIKR